MKIKTEKLLKPSVSNIGYLGVGKYKAYNNEDKPYRSYTVWQNMIKRCYDKKVQKKHSSYIDCTVCEEWLNYQNFAKWYEENYYEIEGELIHLDKDILVKGNKIYSPDTCVFVPQTINGLFTKSNKLRGDLPIGVTLHKQNSKYKSKYRARCNIGCKRISLGVYQNIEDAFLAYKEYKEKTIKSIADFYKEILPNKIYHALYSYKVEITD